jgi:hypothetical protein
VEEVPISLGDCTDKSVRFVTTFLCLKVFEIQLGYYHFKKRMNVELPVYGRRPR